MVVEWFSLARGEVLLKPERQRRLVPIAIIDKESRHHLPISILVLDTHRYQFVEHECPPHKSAEYLDSWRHLPSVNLTGSG